MTQNTRHPISLKPVLFSLPGMDAVTVQADLEVPSADGAPMRMDVYRPARAGAAPPVVVLVPGYVDEGMQRVLGCRHKEMASTVSWARLIAASGMAAIAYSNRAPAADLGALLRHLAADAPSIGLDGTRLGVWSSSGNVPVALSALLRGAPPPRVACAALCYAYTMDLDGAGHVAEAARTFRFDNACAGRSMDDLAPDIPMFLVRAGRDEMPGLNAALDRFAAAALARNLPLALVNHPEGPHAFDLFDESEMSREVVRTVLGFLGFHLRAAPRP